VVAPLVPILVEIHVEPDDFAGSAWPGFERGLTVMADVRRRLTAATRSAVHFNWLVRADHHVSGLHGSSRWALDHYAENFNALAGLGDELGVHVHPCRRDESSGGWVHDFREDVVLANLATALSAFRSALGRPARVMSVAMSWLSNEVVRHAELAGVACDLTLVPNWNFRAFPKKFAGGSGKPLGLQSIPRRPYRPAPDDFERPDPTRREGIWLIPATPGPLHPRAGRFLQWLEFALGRSNRRLFLRAGPVGFALALATALRQEQPYVVFSINSSLFCSRRGLRGLEKSVRYLETHDQAARFRFATAHELLQLMGLRENAS
jgi:hypothetical protein